MAPARGDERMIRIQERPGTRACANDAGATAGLRSAATPGREQAWPRGLNGSPARLLLRASSRSGSGSTRRSRRAGPSPAARAPGSRRSTCWRRPGSRPWRSAVRPRRSNRPASRWSPGSTRSSRAIPAARTRADRRCRCSCSIPAMRQTSSSITCRRSRPATTRCTRSTATRWRSASRASTTSRATTAANSASSRRCTPSSSRCGRRDRRPGPGPLTPQPDGVPDPPGPRDPRWRQRALLRAGGGAGAAGPAGLRALVPCSRGRARRR